MISKLNLSGNEFLTVSAIYQSKVSLADRNIRWHGNLITMGVNACRYVLAGWEYG